MYRDRVGKTKLFQRSRTMPFVVEFSPTRALRVTDSDSQYINFGYARLLPAVEYAVTPSTVTKTGITPLQFTLTDIEGSPIAGASLKVVGQSVEAITDELGVAQLSVSAPKKGAKTAQFQISAAGFQTETIDIDVK